MNHRQGEKWMYKTALLRKFTLTFTLLSLALVMLFPIVITFTNSFMTEREINLNYSLIGTITDLGGQDVFINLKLIPDWVSFGQFGKIMIQSPKFLLMFWNSVFLVVPIILGQTIVAVLAAYAFSMLRFPGRDTLFLVYILTMLMPFQVTLVPNYIIADQLGLLNRSASIILPGIFATYGVFLLRQFFLHIPNPLMEAAKIDGAGHLRIFFSIVLPLVKPGLAALIILLFVDYWNMVEQPLIFLDDPFKYPLSVYLSNILKDERGVGFAASLLYMSPIVLLFLYAESYFIKGVQSSGIKG
jgi:multiple sugar transport system permease protein